MAWTPTRATLNPRAIAENLLTYCLDADRQESAIRWANNDTPLRNINRVSDIKANTNAAPYPAVEFSDDNDEQEFGDDIIACVYTVTFDFGVQATTTAEAVSMARIYDKAFKSMMLNCPTSSLESGVGAVAGTAQIVNIQTGFLPIQAGNQGKAVNDFLQQFQMRVIISLVGNAHI